MELDLADVTEIYGKQIAQLVVENAQLRAEVRRLIEAMNGSPDAE